ncbi:multiheme c-type cytochrome [Marichromatium sp. AB31]|uniref:multiheme c-type cytochrome n=1 Tax=Marichromatium sp. AB31 TaxID=2483362 RepID=UPI000F41CD57|nr:multiheme c-type cytochrome [Marichromatium sp. AB31]MBO8085339.1 nitrite reductase [Marichromatium sp.]RNE88516.1 nitrite reductase [Marichromatium sp. AB31]
MKHVLAPLLQTRRRRLLLAGALALLALYLVYRLLYPVLFDAYVGKINAPLDYASSRALTDQAFERMARDLTEEARRARAAERVEAEAESAFAREVRIEILMNTPSVVRATEPSHIKYFREAGIRRYEGPKTCLQCHATIEVTHGDGTTSVVDTLDDLVNSVHFKFQSDSPGFSTYGYDGREVNAPGERPIPVGKINRACGIPGSFSWTGWAALIESRPEHAEGEVVLRSEGCGQCHIGGNYQPATEKMMPIGDVPTEAKAGIDCLICHATDYDMNQRYVIEDAHGLRWNQDRSMRAALTVGPVTSDNCLRCHQHNMGGDAYHANQAAQALGERHQRLLHQGAKRGNPFSPEADVHAAADIQCTDCHVPEGHKIPRGRFGVDLVANDLPDKEVACEGCHSRAPHNASEHKALLNGHIDRLACETCHITALEDNNVVLRDWVHPTWNAEEGIYEPTDIYRSGAPGKGFTYLWFNGNGTFLANALGSNPDGDGSYDPLMAQIARIDDPEVIAAVRARAEALKADYPEIDVEAYVRAATDPLSQLTPELLAQRRAMIERNLRPVMEGGKSRIYPFKLFNAMMYEDTANQGPFGAMILPFDYATYYATGDSRAAVVQALRDPIVQRMYQTPFKVYMMDEFMAYFGVLDGWTANYPLDETGRLGPQVEPHWMRQMGTLMVNHGIQREAHGCADCHAPDGIMDFRALGYGERRAAELEQLDGLDLGRIDEH